LKVAFTTVETNCGAPLEGIDKSRMGLAWERWWPTLRLHSCSQTWGCSFTYEVVVVTFSTWFK